MPEAKDIAALIERVEKLTGPDRLVDMEIAWLTGWDRVSSHGSTWRETYPRCRERWQAHEERRVADNWKVPDYLGSIDAAVALAERVMPGYRLGIEREIHSENGWKAFVQILWGPESNRRWIAETCSTPAFALVLATLKALSNGRDTP